MSRYLNGAAAAALLAAVALVLTRAISVPQAFQSISWTTIVLIAGMIPLSTAFIQTGTADLVSALEWVRDNIDRFGGDPGNVMIFGQSGGGGKVVRMMHMPAAKGLFHKVAAQSGGNNTYRGSDVAANIKAQQAIAAHTLKNLNLTSV